MKYYENFMKKKDSIENLSYKKFFSLTEAQLEVERLWRDIVNVDGEHPLSDIASKSEVLMQFIAEIKSNNIFFFWKSRIFFQFQNPESAVEKCQQFLTEIDRIEDLMQQQSIK